MMHRGRAMMLPLASDADPLRSMARPGRQLHQDRGDHMVSRVDCAETFLRARPDQTSLQVEGRHRGPAPLPFSNLVRHPVIHRKP